MRDQPCYHQRMNKHKRTGRRGFPVTRVLVATLLLSLLMSVSHAENKVVVLEIKGGIGVATADYVISGIEYAEETAAELVIIDMDTPGGLMGPMRDIVQAILGSSVPVATYVTPAGARADSAGTYILFASHIAVMTPTSHLGNGRRRWVWSTSTSSTPPTSRSTWTCC